MKVLKLSFAAAGLGLVACSISFAVPAIPVGLLCFYFFACWLLWLVCVFASVKSQPVLVAGLWLLLNLDVLVMFLAISSSVGDVRSSQGTELVWFISYAPVVVPTAFAVHPAMPEAHRTLSAVSPPFSAVVADWLDFAYVALVQSLLIALIAWSTASFVGAKRK